MGYHFTGEPSAWPSIHGSKLYQSWITVPPRLTLTKSNDFPVPGHVPWLLHHHDNSNVRHHLLAQLLQESSVVDRATPESIGILYVLGDSLEWLMQDSTTPQEPKQPSLHKHLQHQQSSYPAVVQDLVTQLLTDTSALPDHRAPEELSENALYGAIAAVIKGLSHRENLALAFSSLAHSPLSFTTMGCLLGAWGGVSLIPTPWMRLLTPDSRWGIAQLAEALYQQWAGLGPTANTREVLPLDL